MIGIVIFDPKHAGIEYINPAGRAMLGIAQDAMDLNLYNFLPEFPRSDKKLSKEKLLSFEGHFSNILMHKENSSIFIASLFLKDLPKEFKSKKLVTIQDITHQKKLQREQQSYWMLLPLIRYQKLYAPF